MTKIKLNSWISTIAITYFMVGFLFATAFAIYYRWPFLSFLSPNFYKVILTWPIQTSGFVTDVVTYGLVGKPLPAQ